MNHKIKLSVTFMTIITFLLLFIYPPFLMLIFELFPALDSSPARVLERFLHPDTKYSSGYTEEKFAAVKIGMREREVLNILGEPLIRWRPYQYTSFADKRDYVGFQYSESPTSGHYHLRQINLDNDTVAEIIHYFYID